MTARRAVAASRATATDFVAPLLAYAYDASLAWWLILCPTRTAREPRPSTTQILSVLSGEERQVGRLTADVWRIPDELDDASWLRLFYERLDIPVRVHGPITSLAPTSSNIQLFGESHLDADSRLVVLNIPWSELRRTGTRLRGDSSNLIAMQHGVLGHAPWYLAAAKERAGGMRVQIEEYVEPLRPADAARTALNPQRLQPSGSHILDFRGVGLVDAYLTAKLAPWTRNLETLATTLEYASRMSSPRKTLSHARRVTEHLVGAQARLERVTDYDRADSDDFGRALVAIGLAKEVRKKAFLGHSYPSVELADGILADSLQRLVYLSLTCPDEFQLRALSAARLAQLPELWRYLQALGRDGEGEAQSSEIVRISSWIIDRALTLLSVLLVRWWQFAEAELRTSAPLLKALCTPEALHRKAAEIVAVRSGVMTKQVLLRDVRRLG